MSKPTFKSSTWLIRNLWKSKVLDYSKVPILDTIFYDSFSNSYIWLFTDKSGLVKKKSQSNSTKERIIKKFLTLSPDREIISHKIIGNRFVPINKYNFDSGQLDDLNLDTALQLSKPVLGEGSTKIYSEFRLDEGRPVIKHYKKYTSEGQEVQVGLSAQNVTEALRVIGEHIVNVLEKNAPVKISGLTLIFIQDAERQIWLMGSSECWLYEKTANFRSLTPMKTLQVIKPPSLNSTSVISRTQNNLHSNRNRSSMTFKKCAGDYCEYTLDKHEKNLDKGETDYDELISKITFAYYSDNIGINSKAKQELGANYVEKEHEKLKLLQFANSIPYKYILIGKTLLDGRSKGEHFEITDEEIKKAEEPEYRAADRPPNPLAHPSRLYDEAKVCDRCYEVYSLIRSLKTKPKVFKNLPRINRDIPQYFKIDNQPIQEALGDESKLVTKGSKREFSMLYKLAMGATSSKAEKSGLEEVTDKFFHNEFIGGWGIKTQQEKNSESWKKYIGSLKKKSVLRNKLKTNINYK